MTNIRLTINIGPDPERQSWVAECLELGVSSNGLTPQLVFSSLANAVRAMVNNTLEQRRMVDPSAGVDVMHEIARGYAASKSRSSGDLTDKELSEYADAVCTHLPTARMANELVRLRKATAGEVSLTCPIHAGSTHGAEAEELRSGIEAMIEEDRVGVTELLHLLDRVDARDSLAYLERMDAAATARLSPKEREVALRMRSSIRYSGEFAEFLDGLLGETAQEAKP